MVRRNEVSVHERASRKVLADAASGIQVQVQDGGPEEGDFTSTEHTTQPIPSQKSSQCLQ